MSIFTKLVFAIFQSLRPTRARRVLEDDYLVPPAGLYHGDAPSPPGRGGGGDRPRAADRVLEPHRPRRLRRREFQSTESVGSPGRGRRRATAAARARSATSSSPRSPSGTCPTRSTSSGRSAGTTWGRRSLDLLSKLRYSGARESQITHSSARSQPHASTGPFVHPNASWTRADGTSTLLACGCASGKKIGSCPPGALLVAGALAQRSEAKGCPSEGNEAPA